MGQRLNIEIRQDNVVKANAYYHWSAFTGSSIELAKEIVEHADEFKDSDPTIKAVRLLEITGAGLTPDELGYAEEAYIGVEFEPATNRNDGLIAITKEGIESTRDWEEGRVTIDLDTKTVDFQVYSIISEDEYEDWGVVLDEITAVIPFNLEEVPFESLNELKEFFVNNSYFKVEGETKQVYTIIE